jgi:hypothetical protein
VTPPRRLLPLLVLAVFLAVAVPAAFADGDPASDVLLFDDVFLPVGAPQEAPFTTLVSTVKDANEQGFRMKLAVIQSEKDLGSVPSLFGKPQDYAHFLGSEIKFKYAGPLVVVMPGGFGFWNNGKPTKDADAVLASIGRGSRGEELANAGIKAVAALLGTGRPPSAQALRGKARAGTVAQLLYRTGPSKHPVVVGVTVERGKKVLKRATQRIGASARGGAHVLAWKIPAHTSGTLTFCVTPETAVGWTGKTSCAPLTVRGA